jgi:unsaturated rhamnogalacturonyl hydrolase
MMKYKFFLKILFLLIAAVPATAQKIPWSEWMAKSIIIRQPDTLKVPHKKYAQWNYEQGLVLKALEKVWNDTGDSSILLYIKKNTDYFVSEQGDIRTYRKEDYNLDNIASGKSLLTLYNQELPDKEKYKKAADKLWNQLIDQPKTKSGGYWHKKIYPWQIWLDGLFMAEPFAAEYASIFHHPEHFDQIALQFSLVEKHMVNHQNGLIYHGYDESKSQQWADSETGLSPQFWGRAIGWYAMALVDVLDYFPENHPKRPILIASLNRLAPALATYQDHKTGVWYQIVDMAGRQGNYPEASSTCMFVYSLAKGVRLGYIPNHFKQTAIRGYEGILREFITRENDDTISLTGTVSVGGLGGKPYRDGSYAYYLSEPVRTNDLKGTGAFIFASTEIEQLKKAESID